MPQKQEYIIELKAVEKVTKTVAKVKKDFEELQKMLGMEDARKPGVSGKQQGVGKSIENAGKRFLSYAKEADKTFVKIEGRMKGIVKVLDRSIRQASGAGAGGNISIPTGGKGGQGISPQMLEQLLGGKGGGLAKFLKVGGGGGGAGAAVAGGAAAGALGGLLLGGYLSYKLIKGSYQLGSSMARDAREIGQAQSESVRLTGMPLISGSVTGQYTGTEAAGGIAEMLRTSGRAVGRGGALYSPIAQPGQDAKEVMRARKQGVYRTRAAIETTATALGISAEEAGGMLGGFGRYSRTARTTGLGAEGVMGVGRREMLRAGGYGAAGGFQGTRLHEFLRGIEESITEGAKRGAEYQAVPLSKLTARIATGRGLGEAAAGLATGGRVAMERAAMTGGGTAETDFEYGAAARTLAKRGITADYKTIMNLLGGVRQFRGAKGKQIEIEESDLARGRVGYAKEMFGKEGGMWAMWKAFGGQYTPEVIEKYMGAVEGRTTTKSLEEYTKTEQQLMRTGHAETAAAQGALAMGAAGGAGLTGLPEREKAAAIRNEQIKTQSDWMLAARDQINMEVGMKTAFSNLTQVTSFAADAVNVLTQAVEKLGKITRWVGGGDKAANTTGQ